MTVQEILALVRKTIVDPLLIPIKWLVSFFNPDDRRTSMKRAGMAASVVMLCISCWKITDAYADMIRTGTWHPVMADVSLLATITVPLASLAGAAYLMRRDGSIETKPDKPQTPETPDKPEETETPKVPETFDPKTEDPK